MMAQLPHGLITETGNEHKKNTSTQINNHPTTYTVRDNKIS